MIIWLYTISGGLFSVAYTDCVQGSIGWIGALVTAFWFIHNSTPSAPPPSQGFPEYVYPNSDICSLYDGVSCMINNSSCCFNDQSTLNLTRDNGAYPIGDKRVFNNQMFSARALTPFPNAIFWNWATIFILGIGNMGALDFQARCMASKSSRTAIIGCLIASVITILIGVPFSYLGAITRYVYDNVTFLMSP